MTRTSPIQPRRCRPAAFPALLAAACLASGLSAWASAQVLELRPAPDPAIPQPSDAPAVEVVAAPPPPARQHDPDAIAVLDAAEEAIRELGSFRARVRGSGTNFFRGMTDEGSAVLIGRRSPEDAGRWQARITGSLTPQRSSSPIDVDAVFDGNRVKWINHDQRRIGARMMPALMNQTWYDVPVRIHTRLWFGPQPFGDVRGLGRVSLAPRETVGGVECDVVRAEMEGGYYFLLYVGAEDRIPRRFLRGFDSRNIPGGMPMTGTEILDIAELEIGVELRDEDFVIACPEGYVEEHFPDPNPTRPVPTTPKPVTEGGDEAGEDEGAIAAEADGAALDDGQVVVSRVTGAAPEVRRPAAELAPEFELRDVGGTPVRLSDYRGGPVLLYFWASWSPWCAELSRELRAIRTEHEGLPILVLPLRERSADIARQRFEAQGLRATLLTGADDIAARFQIGAAPSLVLVDAAGRIAMRHAGFNAERSPLPELRSLLAGR